MILIRTHHKTGTVWMIRVFSMIARRLRLRFCNLQKHGLTDADIYLSPHAPFPPELLAREGRGFHLIRDPRDVVLSGMHYHRRSSEQWLHVPDPAYGGLSYQERLSRLDDEEGLYFEMQFAGRFVTREMLDWNYDDPRFFEARYEDLVGPQGTLLFGEILRFVGIADDHLETAIAVFKQNSLAESGFQLKRSDPHIRSGRPRQWQSDFRRRHGQRFLEIFGDSLIRLGYEQDDSWVDRLPE